MAAGPASPFGLETRIGLAHLEGMDHAVNQSPPGWAEALARSETELARGERVPAHIVHNDIGAALAELASEADARRDSTSGSHQRR